MQGSAAAHVRALRRAAALLAGVLVAACATSPAPDARDPIAARATPVRLAATADDDFADLAPFGAAVGSARIVALDEQTHGGHEEFVLKTRLLRYLHERLGFDVLVLESGFFDVGRIQQARESGAKVDALAPDNIFYIYSKSAEGRALLQYVDATQATAHPLVLAGMDSQHSGALSAKELVPSLAAFLHAHGSRTPESAGWAGFSASVAALVALRPQPPSAAELAAFDAVLARAGGELELLTHRPPAAIGSAGWWQRVLVDLGAQSRNAWTAPASRARDRAMGDNVAWIANDFAPGRRLVVWGHAIHLMHDASEPGSPPFAGTVIRSAFRADYHVAHLTGFAGSVLDYTSLQPVAVPAAPPGTLEARLAAVPGAALYLPPPATPDPAAPPARFIDYQTFGASPGRGVNWESTFFIRALTPASMVR